MRYKDYTAAVRYSETDETFVGRVVNVHDIIVFDGQSVAELTESFHAAMDEYLEDCAERGLQPGKPASGRFNVRVSPTLHRSLQECAAIQDVSLNDAVTRALEEYVGNRTD